MEYILVGLIVLLAAAAVIYRIYRKATGKGGCDCGNKNPACRQGQHCNLPQIDWREPKEL